MRIWILALVTAALGTAAGLGGTWWEMSSTDEQYGLKATGISAISRQVPGVAKVTLVNGDEHDFGIMTKEESKPFTFQVRNDGDGVLELRQEQVSCPLCVSTSLTAVRVQPGETADIPVTLSAHKDGPDLKESLEIRTNDPEFQRITFRLVGYVTKAARASVSELMLGSISSGEETSARFRVFGYLHDKLDILEKEVTNAPDPSRFEINVRELSRAEFEKTEPRALVGQEVEVRVKPGLPIGPIEQKVRLLTRAKEDLTLSVSLRGQVVSDIALLGGANFYPEKNLLDWGRVLASKGHTERLTVVVKGPHRHDVQVSIAAVDPAGSLRAVLGEPTVSTNGNLRIFPLTLEVPAGAPSVNRLGTAQFKTGTIAIQTTHPVAKEVTLYVRFVVE